MSERVHERHWLEPQAWLAPLLIAAAALAIQPYGDFPILDDFDYIATVQDFRRTGEMRLSDWPSMTLVAQVWWGSLFATVIGDSFLALRVSTLTLLAVGSIAAYSFLRGMGASRSASAFGASAVALSPQTLYFACSFMTDVPGLAMTLVTLWACSSAVKSGSATAWIRASAVASVAYLFRQTSVIPAIAALLVELARGRWRTVFTFVPLPLATAVLYRVWLEGHGLPHHAHVVLIDPSVLVSPARLLERLGRIVATCGLYLAPIAALWIGRTASMDLKSKRIGAAVAAAALLLSVFFSSFIPYDTSTVFDCGLGADCSINRIDSLEGLRIFAFGRIHSVFRVFCTLASAASLGACVAAVVHSRAREWNDRERLLGLSVAGCMSFALISGSFFERYLIPVWSLLMLPLTLAAPKPSRWSWIVLLTAALLGIAGSQDYFCRFRTTWTALNDLLARAVPASAIDGGMEFAGWHRFNPLFRGKTERLKPYLAKLTDEQRIELIVPMEINPFTPYRLRLPFAVVYFPNKELVIRTYQYRSWVRSGQVFLVSRTQHKRSSD
jgi:hypothetical protein